MSVAPELCALTILEAALETTNAALFAAQPTLLLAHDVDPSDACIIAAQIIEQSLHLRAIISRYRLALIVDPGPDGPLPF